MLIVLSATMGGTETDRLLNDLGSDDFKVAQKAETTLLKLGKHDPVIVKGLARNLAKGSHNQKYLSASILGRIGANSRPTIPALTRVFLDDKEDENIRSMCASALAMIGHESIDVFRKALNRDSRFVKKEAADGLAHIAVKDDAVLPDLILTLANDDEDVREIALGGLIETAERSKALLRKAATDKNSYISVLATEALLQLGDRRGSLVDNQLSLLNHDSKHVRYYAIRSLRLVKTKATLIVPAVTRLLEDGDAENRRSAIFTIASFGKDARPSLSAIKKCLKDVNVSVRIEAIETIGRLATRDADTTRDLIPLLNDDHPDVIGATIEVLGNFGIHAKDAIPALQRVQADERFRLMARKAIRQIKGKP